MAKDSAQSRIPRLDGVARIPVQTAPVRIAQQKSHYVTAATATKVVRPSSFSGLRPPISTMASLKKSLSGEKISEAATLVSKKTATVVKKFLTKPEKSSNIDAIPLPIMKTSTKDETIILDKGMKDSANQKLAGQESFSNITRSLTRSETFIRDSNDDTENNLLGVTHDVIPSTPDVIMSPKMIANNSEFTTRNLIQTTQILGSNVTIDANTKASSELFGDTISCERLSDISLPSYDPDATLKPMSDSNSLKNLMNLTTTFDETITLAPDKGDMKLVLNSTMNNERLLDITSNISPAHQLINLTRDFVDSPPGLKNTTNLLYMSRDDINDPVMIPPGKKSNTQTPDDFLDCKMEDNIFEIPANVSQVLSSNALQELKQGKPRFSFGLDLTECTLDCSIELCDVSLSSSAPAQVTSPSLKKQNSFEMDESLGILTPDQMKEFLDSTTTTTNLDLPINMQQGGKISLHQMRIDQTPSPEDLPLDPVGVKTDISDVIMSQHPPASQNVVPYTELSQTDSDSKTDQMTKSNVSKVSTSFITSVTSITSLDTGYQGDGEMSRPASRGAGDHSPSNGPRKPQLGRQPSFNQNNQANIPIRRQDPMTDSDFFTESDADDIFHRGDRRAQVIDGQLYGPMLQPSNVFISEQPQMEDSCMESSGIFTDVENRCDDDIAQSRREADIDMSPDGSTDTVKSNNNNNNNNNTNQSGDQHRSVSPLSQGHTNLTDSQTSTIQSSLSSERLSMHHHGGSVCSISGDYSLQSKRNNNFEQTIGKSSANSDSVGALSIKSTTSSISNDDKKATVAQKLQQNSTQPSVKKSSPARKQHSHGGKIENKANVNAIEKSSKTGKGGGCGTIGTKSTVVLSANVKKSTSGILSDLSAGGDMVMKYNSSGCSGPKVSGDYNQENKFPGGGPAGTPVSILAATRKAVPNKWDAVMNKIAESKVYKKNYSEVKSRVSTGVLLRRSPPSASKSPTGQSQDSNCPSVNSASGLSSPQTKRLLQAVAKRGRSYSKDSQRSSQSDISLSGGSPKIHTKTPTGTRSAKKRDVRTLSISPTDLGPPPKTQTNVTSRTKQQPALPPKRLPPNLTPTLPSPLPGSKGSPPAKKVVARRPQVPPSHPKVPLKDHNRLVSHTQQNQSQQQQQQQQQQHQQNGNPKSGINSGIKGVVSASSTPLQQVCGNIKGTARNSLEHSPSSPILGNNNNISQPSAILQQNHKKHLYHHQELEELHQQQKSSQGVLEFHLAHANRGVEALGVLLQYLAHDLDAFLCPTLKKECAKAKKNLLETRLQLEETKSSCHDLHDQLQDKEAYYSARESELQALHRCELQKVEATLHEFETSAKERVATLEAELALKDAASQKKLEEYIRETEEKFREKEIEIKAAKEREQELLNRLSTLTTTENELREKILAAENSFAERWQAASQRERELTDKINILNKQLDALRQQTEQRERELEEKLNLSHDEISVLRLSKNAQDPAISPRNGPANKLQMLQDEVESLRCVLELKQSEISDLRKYNQELQRAADELPAAQMKISALESRVEDLQIQLKSKSEEEKELVVRNKQLQESYTHEVKNRNRLSLHNEELQWRLKQNSEKFALVLTELSKSYQDQAGYLSISKSSFHSQDNPDLSHNSSLTSLTRSMNGSDRIVGCFQMDDISPPTSPIIKGVVEKSDSVSWVLEMDDESPEVLASRMVRRAGSFRSSLNEKSPGAKRQHSLPAQNSVINPLTQSASATSVIRQHSTDVADSSSLRVAPSSSRIRSKSVTIKNSDQKKLTRQSSIGNGTASRKTEFSGSWKEPICASSPYCRRLSNSSSPKGSGSIAHSPPASTSSGQRPKTFSPENENGGGGGYRKVQRNLITCDTSALTSSSERLEMRTIPSSHPSVQDFKSLKKCQEIQESAGEAMVSGTNSEDEGCSASSDETVSLTSSTSTSSLGRKHISIEDALLIDKISTSLGGTPMEVSWSDDADQFPSESIV